MDKFLASKKVKGLLLGLVVSLLAPVLIKLGISEEMLLKILTGVWAMVSAFVLGQGVADGLSGGKTSSANTEPPS